MENKMKFESLLSSEKRITITNWFQELQCAICDAMLDIERELGGDKLFLDKKWTRDGGGGISKFMRDGIYLEKGGVNFSEVWGTFSENFAAEIKYASPDRGFWASGVSLVFHPRSPFCPIVHMNTRVIVSDTIWFGGGIDMTPSLPFTEDEIEMKTSLKKACDAYDNDCYEKFSSWCDNYFYLPHRKERRGVGGIFYDYLTGDFDKLFSFTKSVGMSLIDFYPKIARRRFRNSWGVKEREIQKIKRSKYAEFNLMFDRGTRFGIMTGGDTEAIFMSLPPEAGW